MPKGLPRAALSIGKKEDKTSWGYRCYQGEASEIFENQFENLWFFLYFCIKDKIILFNYTK